MHPPKAPRHPHAKDLPFDLKDAFIDALDAWTQVEHQLFMLYQFLSAPRAIDVAWAAFCEMKSLTRQCDATGQLARERIADETISRDCMRIIERIRKLARKRNALVHGRWMTMEIVDGSDRLADIEYLRRYDPPDAATARPTNYMQEDQNKGKTRFYTQDMNRMVDHFRKLAQDMLFLMEAVAKQHSRFRPMPSPAPETAPPQSPACR